MMNQVPIQGYLYVINYAEGEESLCQLEMKVLFNQELKEKYLFSELAIDPSRSIFIKERLTILYRHQTYEGLYEQVKTNPLSYETFKCLFLRFPHQTVTYQERLNQLKHIGFLIGGEADMYEPKQLLGLTELNGEWLFGTLEPNSNEWVSHENKPHSYSFSLSVRVSRAIANLAVGRHPHKKIIDPCCGAGTVVLEVLTVGGDIVGNELNPKVAQKAVENLKHYGYDSVIQVGDIQDIKDHYDLAIIDLPYGHFNPIAPEIQQMIMKEARRIANELIIVTQVKMDEQLKEAGFEIVEQCEAVKGKFTRYITMCC
ncbi:MAG: methyltransferase domain-containing protein [Turicibacter sp.]|nr:methyltransferase domain-containing protein [Turicibacter sp.]